MTQSTTSMPVTRSSRRLEKTPKQPAKAKSPSPEVESPKVEVEEEQDESDQDDLQEYNLSEKEMKEINNAFDLNCSSKEEWMTNDELKTAIRSLGYEPRAKEVKDLLKKFSKKANKINRNGFHKLMAFKISSAPGSRDSRPNDEISRVFNLLDLDKTGMITLSNLKSIAKELNEDIKEEELREMIDEADLDGDKMINKDEFAEIMKKTSLY